VDIATRRAYVQARLDKARDNLTQKHWRGAISRAYYTVFHTASAALLWYATERARHSGIQSAFGEHFIKTGIIESEYGALYSRARRARERHDYDLDVAFPSAEEAEQIVTDAERFAARMERHLHDVGGID
jgi:uncharacterized protein (UPF0332 family)